MKQEEFNSEAKKYARRFEENEQSGYNGESLSIEDKAEMIAFIAGAKSDVAKKYWYKQFEKEKLEFAIEIIKDMDKKCFGGSNTCKAKIQELEQKLLEL